MAGFPRVIAPLVTPYRSDLSLDVEAARRLYARLAGLGVGLFVAGTTGEMPLLTLQEKEALVSAALDAARGRVPVLAGAGGPDPSRVLWEARSLIDAGADAVVVPPPYYYPLPPSQVEAFYSWLAGLVDGRVILYTIPSHTGVDVPVDVVERLAVEHSNIVGVKATVDSSIYQFTLVSRLKAARADFLVYSGFDHLLPYNLVAGGDGGIVAGANIAPLLHVDLAESIDRGDMAKTRDGIRLFWSLLRVLSAGRSVPGSIKVVLASEGLIESYAVRPPLPPEDDLSASRVREAWESAGLRGFLGAED